MDVGLLSLAVELIDAITSDFSQEDLCNLRLVARRLNASLTPRIFKRIIVNISANKLARVQDQIAFLSVCASMYARELEIRSLGPLKCTLFKRNDPRAALADALASMRRVTRISLTLCDEPDWLANAVIRALAALPQLTAFTLRLSRLERECPPLDLLHGLSALTVTGPSPRFCEDIVPLLRRTIVRSPALEHLEVGMRFWWGGGIPTLHDILPDTGTAPLPLKHLGLGCCLTQLDTHTLPYFRGLTSFTWVQLNCDDDDDDAPRLMWAAFQREGIHLTQLRASHVDHALLAYLAAYRGLCTLTLVNGDQSDALARAFYNEVLPMHASTLKELHVRAVYEDDWCFGDHNRDALLACSKLEKLSISIQMEESSDVQSHASVHVLLNEITALKCLHTLNLATAAPTWTRNSMCGNPMIQYKYHVAEVVRVALDTFQATDEAQGPNEVCFGSQLYRLCGGRYCKTVDRIPDPLLIF